MAEAADSMSSSGAVPVQSATAHENIIFNEQRIPVVGAGVLAQSAFKPDLAHESSMPEGPWTFDQTLTRAQKIATYQWTTSHSTGTTLTTINVPTTFYALNNFTINTLRMMAFFRSDFVIKFQLNSQASNCGKVLCWFNPLGIRDTSTSQLQVNFGVHLFNAVCMPHVWLDASESTEGELEIPWRHFLNFFDLEGANVFSFLNLGSIHVDVFNPLQVVPTSTNSVNITAWFYAKEPRLHVPIRPFSLPTTAKRLNNAGDVYEPGRGIIEGEAQMEDVKTGITSGAAAINSFTSGDYKGAMNSVNKTVNAVNNIVQANCDKPSVSDLVTLNETVSLGGAAFGAGLDASQRLGLSSTSKTTHAEDIFGDNRKEMDLSRIVKIPSIVKILEWPTSAPSGAVLFSFPVFPGYVLLQDASPSIFYASYSNLGWACCKHDMWKGSIVYTISLATTGLHSGKLMCSFKPNRDTNSAYPDLYTNPSMTMDIKNGMKNFQFTCPYYSKTPWKLNTNATYDATANVSYGTRGSSNILGSFNISVLNPLVAPMGVAATVQMNISISGGDDFRVHYPSENHPPFTAFPWIPATKREIIEGEAQAEEAPAQIAWTVDRSVALPNSNYVTQGSSGKVTSNEEFMDGEDHMDLRNTLKRKTMMMIQNLNILPAPTAQRIRVPMYPGFTRYNTLNGPLVDSAPYDLLGHWASSYVFYSGSQRIALLTPCSKNADIFLTATFKPNLHDIYQYNADNVLIPSGLFNNAVTYQNLSASPDFQIEVPFTSFTFQKVTCLPITQVVGNFIESSVVGNLEIHLFPSRVPDASISTGVEYILFHAAGDDFTLSYYIGPPCFICDKTVFTSIS
jgi:hypothetical protein